MPLADAARALLDERRPVTRDEVAAVAALPLDRLPDVVALAHRVRLAYCGPEVELESLINAKSGACPEDCAFCSQSARFETGVDVYAFLDVDEVIGAVRRSDCSARCSTPSTPCTARRGSKSPARSGC